MAENFELSFLSNQPLWVWGFAIYFGIGVCLAVALVDGALFKSRGRLSEDLLVVLGLIGLALFWPVMLLIRILVRRFWPTYND